LSTFFQNNWVDLLFLTTIVGFAFASRGFIATSLEILSFIVSLFFSFQTFSLFGNLLVKYFHTPRGIANAGGFFIAWSLVELVLYFVVYFISNSYLLRFHQGSLNRKLGFIAGIVQGLLIYLFLISIIFALPVKGSIKNAILQSKVGPAFVNASQSLQLQSKNVFGGAVSEALNFLTIEPESNERVSLGFSLKETQMSVDEDSEQKMVALVNQEREKRGLNSLQVDPELTALARSYAKTMFENGFFSHVSKVDGSSPGDRADRAGVQYMVLGENLAFAPDVYLAHQGLMNSPGHRANILGADYGKVGIGIIDGGVYGRMFVQEFSN
jgi:uncharacterized protein YkwD